LFEVNYLGKIYKSWGECKIPNSHDQIFNFLLLLLVIHIIDKIIHVFVITG